MRKVMIIVIDGCAPEYLTQKTAPKIFSLIKKEGSFSKRILGSVPTVTNVNHASIVSGLFPEDTGVVGNYYYHPDTEEEGFIEDSKFMKAETIFKKYKNNGKTSALLTVKGKVLQVFGQDADLGISVQTPDRSILDDLGLSIPPEVQSIESSQWIFQAAYQVIKQKSPDLVYCTTNDFVMHHYGPDTYEAMAQIGTIDDYVAKIHELEPYREIYITADHGMNQKTTLINLQEMVDDAGFHVKCVPPLKDRYIENHIYQEGGILYLYVKNQSEKEKFLRFVRTQEAVEQVLDAVTAAKEYNLPQDAIGDFVAFAGKDFAFGEVKNHILHSDKVRTHGSLHEREIPLIAINSNNAPEQYEYSKDIVRNLYI
ncbi:MAG: alkaline phosphatase family protein [Anaerovoracaceae bacterium]